MWRKGLKRMPSKGREDNSMVHTLFPIEIYKRRREKEIARKRQNRNVKKRTQKQ